MEKIKEDISRGGLRKELELTDISISYELGSVRFFYKVRILDNEVVIKKEKKSLFLNRDEFKEFCNNLEQVNLFALTAIKKKEGLTYE